MNPIQKSATWIRTNKAMFLMIALVSSVALIPLYGILFPSVVDLAEHILVSKLLWEKLTGTSHLDLTISWFLGYRLFPILMLVIFSFCTLCRISLVYLPVIVAATLISIHVIVIVSILYCQIQSKSWKSLALAVCFALPAVAGMYSAAWFMGLVNYTLAITLLVPTIFVTERFLRSGKWSDAGLLFLALAMVYMAHPFAPTFWLLWCLCRLVASVATLAIGAEWKKLGLLAPIFLPIFIYHFSYTLSWAGGAARTSASWSFLTQSPFLSMHGWYRDRIHRLHIGYYLNVDNTSESRLFCAFALAFILISIALVFRARQTAQVRKMALSSLFLLFIASWLNENVFPVPSGTWLAYDRRYSLVVYVVCLTIASMVCVRSLPVSTDKWFYKIGFVFLAAVAVLASVDHLLIVRKGYVAFDTPARKYMAKFLKNEPAVGIYMPRTQWHLDGTYVSHYICLTQPDCVSKGTTFGTGYAAALFPVKLPPASTPIPVAPPEVAARRSHRYH